MKVAFKLCSTRTENRYGLHQIVVLTPEFVIGSLAPPRPCDMTEGILHRGIVISTALTVIILCCCKLVCQIVPKIPVYVCEGYRVRTLNSIVPYYWYFSMHFTGNYWYDAKVQPKLTIISPNRCHQYCRGV